MLTADLALNWVRGGRIEPRYIDPNNSNYLRVSDDLITVIRQHQGLRRAELDQALQEYVGVGTDYKILRGLIKLVTDQCLFEAISPVDPVEIRRALFLAACSHHPVSAGEEIRQQVISETAAKLNCKPEDVTENLYADLFANQTLTQFEEMNAEQLLDRYNLAQAQALFYRCTEMRLRIEPQAAAGYRRLFDAIKAYRLIHTIKGSPATGYDIRLDGPVSIFHQSQKYGIQMAVFLPALLLCQGWRLKAEVAYKSDSRATFELSSRETRLRSHYLDDVSYKPAVEEKLISSWAKTDDGWLLESASEIIGLGESAFIPDFVISNPGGQKFYLEVFGFWTPRHLDDRLKDFERAGFKNFLLAVSEELRGSREQPLDLPPNVVVFKSSLNAAAVKMAVEGLA
jgi:predicted nuclease of restriction endonuclease-like RecB superfamily